MTDLRLLLIETLKNDAVFRVLTGATNEDPRCYWYFQGDAEITLAKPAYVTYALMTSQEKFRAVREPTFSLALWGKDLTQIDALKSRILALLDQQQLTSPSGRLVFIKKVSETDSYQTTPNFAGANLQFRMGYLDLVA